MITMVSMFYGDASKHLADRVLHLLRKVGVSRWVWSVRPARDCTSTMLSALADYAGKTDEECVIFVEPDEQPDERIERLSVAGDRLLSMACEGADYILWHESDLFSPPDIAAMLAGTPAGAVGGWPVLSHCDDDRSLGVMTPRRVLLEESVFYDTWGYRVAGERFSNRPPHHDAYRPEPFRLDSVGSVVLIDANYIRRGARMNGGGLVGLCDSIRQMGGEVWCDPRVPVVQPVELWTLNDD